VKSSAFAIESSLSETFQIRVVLGKVPASAVGLHPFSLLRAVNDSLPARIFGSRMSQTGRLPPDGAGVSAQICELQVVEPNPKAMVQHTDKTISEK
jgi:hypothetical protein